MGVYDTYNNKVQLKVGECEMLNFKLGDPVAVSDGVYLAPEGIVVVADGKLVATLDKNQLFTKWGDEINMHELLDKHHPAIIAIRQVEAERAG